MQFDPTISLGTLLGFATLLLTLVIIYGKLADRLARLETQVQLLMDWWRGRPDPEA